MESRRKNSIANNINTYVFLTGLSVLFHLSPPSIGLVKLEVVGISYLLVIYAGYKYGKYWGMLSGFLSVGFWLLFTLFTHNDISTMELLLGLSAKGSRYLEYPSIHEFAVAYFAFQSLLIFSAIGYFSGFICDRLEDKLHKHGVTLEDLLPHKETNKETNFVLGVGKWLEKTSKSLFLLQFEPENKDSAIKKRLRNIFNFAATVPLIILFISLSMRWSYNFGDGNSIYIVPVLFSPVLALWLSHRISPAIGVRLSLSLLFSPLVYLFFHELLRLPGFQIYNFAPPLNIVVSLSVAAWLIGTISKQLKDDTLKNKLLPQNEAHDPAKRVSITHIALLFVFSIGLFYRNDSLYISYYSTFVLSSYIVWLSLKHNPLSVSNMIVVVLGSMALFHIQIPLGEGLWRLRLGGISIPEVVFLSLIPFMVRYINLDSLKNIRVLFLGLMLGLSLLFMVFSYYDSSVLPDIFVKIRYENITLPIVSLMLILVLSELLARLAWLRTGKT